MKNVLNTIKTACGIVVTVAALFTPMKVEAQGIRKGLIAQCYLQNMSAATPLSSSICASFTGTGSGKNLTVTSVTGFIQVGMTLAGTGVPIGTTITSQSNGTPGGAGVYVTSVATTSNSASLTAGGIPGVPVNWGTAPGQASADVVLCAYVQGVVMRGDGGAPTSTVGSGGFGLNANQCVEFSSALGNIQSIQQSSGALLGVSFYVSLGQ